MSIIWESFTLIYLIFTAVTSAILTILLLFCFIKYWNYFDSYSVTILICFDLAILLNNGIPLIFVTYSDSNLVA